MKLLHLADLHIGMENYSRTDPATGMNTRLLDYLARLDEAIAIGQESDVDAVLIAGDIYKNRTPNPTHQREFARRIHALRSTGVPVVILTGNHDVSPAAGRAHSIEIFDTLAVEGVLIVDRPRLLRLDTRAGILQIIALPWVTRHNLLAKEELQLKALVEIEAMLLDRIDRFLRQAAEDLDRSLPTVLMAHASIDGATLGAERQVLLGKDLVLSRSMVAQPGVDYVALGHIHRHQSLGEHPPIVYPGSIERIDFGEEHEAKGCVIVDIEPGQARWQFFPLAARPFLTIDVDVRGASDPAERITRAIARHALSDAVVRMRIEADTAQANALSTLDIQRQIETAGAHYVAAVAIEIERPARPRLGTAADELLEGLTPRRALELYLRSRETPEARITALLAAADELAAEQ
ncbi:MAG TPA: exonuclease SbcCD subunit D [Roseiflexaceae bacterium]|nr:exonuclease SbcCD subunit D [Roseiflexaceae bacterium]